MAGNTDPEDQSILSSLTSAVYSRLTVSDVLELVVGLATQTLPDMIGASVSMPAGAEGDRFQTVTASSPVVRDLDDLQYDGRGPCVDAIATGEEVLVLVSEGRYPPFEEAAAQAGVALVRSLPLLDDGNALGALNLYAAKFNGSERDRASADALAAHAALVLSNAVAWDNVHGTNIRLTRALASRAVIGQAQGILMAREHIGPNGAFDMLRRASQRTHRRVRDIAGDLVAQASTRPPTEDDRDADT